MKRRPLSLKQTHAHTHADLAIVFPLLLICLGSFENWFDQVILEMNHFERERETKRGAMAKDMILHGCVYDFIIHGNKYNTSNRAESMEKIKLGTLNFMTSKLWFKPPSREIHMRDRDKEAHSVIVVFQMLQYKNDNNNPLN